MGRGRRRGVSARGMVPLLGRARSGMTGWPSHRSPLWFGESRRRRIRRARPGANRGKEFPHACPFSIGPGSLRPGTGDPRLAGAGLPRRRPIDRRHRARTTACRRRRTPLLLQPGIGYQPALGVRPTSGYQPTTDYQPTPGFQPQPAPAPDNASPMRAPSQGALRLETLRGVPARPHQEAGRG